MGGGSWGDIGKAALMGGAIGGATGAVGGYMKHASVKNSIYNSDNYLAFCDECKEFYKNRPGLLLDEAKVYRFADPRTGLALASGKAAPDYFFEEFVIGGKLLKLGGMAWGAISGAANAAKVVGANLSSNGVKLAKQLASEAQMAEKGITIVGPGKLRDAGRLAQQYGGQPSDWIKKSSSSFTKNGTTFETHWYENITNRVRTEFKTKFH